MPQISISDYPLIIEPTTEVLEVTGGASPDSLGWTQLYRVPTHIVLTHLAGLPSRLIHFFGVSRELVNNQVLLAYTSGGRLEHILRRNDNTWDVLDLPAEVTGTPVIRPSVRLVFKDERARAVFIHHLQQIIDKKAHNPTLALLMDCLAEPIRSIDVWSRADEG